MLKVVLKRYLPIIVKYADIRYDLSHKVFLRYPLVFITTSNAKNVRTSLVFVQKMWKSTTVQNVERMEAFHFGIPLKGIALNVMV